MLQLSLLASGPAVGVDPAARALPRRDLGSGAWLDVIPGWVAGADEFYEQVRSHAPWQARTRVMWDNVVDEPRLSTMGWDAPPDPVPTMADSISERYEVDLTAVSANWYRDGRDSVAWHGDTAGRYRSHTIVAIASLGAERRFHLRPKGGGRSIRLTPGHGDLLVLGGTCQHTWDHAVPKMASAGPRISLMFREPGVF